MKLIEALGNISVENLDTNELIYDNDDWAQPYFFENIETLLSPEDYKLVCELELNDELFEDISQRKQELIEDNMAQIIIDAAWMASQQINYAEVDEEEMDRLYEDCHNYEICFGEPEYSFEYETDIDLT